MVDDIGTIVNGLCKRLKLKKEASSQGFGDHIYFNMNGRNVMIAMYYSYYPGYGPALFCESPGIDEVAERNETIAEIMRALSVIIYYWEYLDREVSRDEEQMALIGHIALDEDLTLGTCLSRRLFNSKSVVGLGFNAEYALAVLRAYSTRIPGNAVERVRYENETGQMRGDPGGSDNEDIREPNTGSGSRVP